MEELKQKEFNVSFSALDQLMPNSSCAFTSIPKWYHEPIVVRRLIYLHMKAGQAYDKINAHSIAYVLPMLFYIAGDEEGFKNLLNSLTLTEQLYLFCPQFFPEEGKILARKAEFKEIAKIGLTHIFNTNPQLAGWDKPDTFITINDTYTTGVAKVASLSKTLPMVSDGHWIYTNNADDELNGEAAEKVFWDTTEFMHKNINRVIVMDDFDKQNSGKKFIIYHVQNTDRTLAPYFKKYKWEIKNELMRQLKEYKTEPRLEAEVNAEESMLKIYAKGRFYKTTEQLRRTLKAYSKEVRDYFNQIGHPIDEDNDYNYDLDGSLWGFRILLESKKLQEVRAINFDYHDLY